MNATVFNLAVGVSDAADVESSSGINFSSKLPCLSLEGDLPLNRLYLFICFLIINPFGASHSLPVSLSLAQV